MPTETSKSSPHFDPVRPPKKPDPKISEIPEKILAKSSLQSYLTKTLEIALFLQNVGGGPFGPKNAFPGGPPPEPPPNPPVQ